MAKFCKKCGTPLTPGKKFCKKCGEPTGVLASEAPITWICPNCGHEGNTKKFCGKCGTSKPSEGVPPGAVQTPGASDVIAPNPPAPPALTTTAPPVQNALEETRTPAPEMVTPPADAQTVGSPSSATKRSWGKLLVPVLVVLAIAAYFGYGKLTEYLYESKCGDCVAVLTESKTVFEELGSLPEDAKPEDAAQKGSVLTQNAEKLGKLAEELAGKKPPEKMKGQHEGLVRAMKADAEMLSGAAAVIQMKEIIHNRDLMTKFTELWKGFSSKWTEANAAAEGVAVKGQSLRDAFPYADAKKAMQAYRRSKSLADAKYMKEQYDQHTQKRKERQKELMAKKEVVFLANDVRKDGSDLVLRGKFYNGTDNIVTSVKNMLVDVKLFLFDAETESLTDVPYEANITGLSLAPGQSTDHVELRLQGKAPAKDFNYFEDHVHKITWGQRRVAG